MALVRGAVPKRPKKRFCLVARSVKMVKALVLGVGGVAGPDGDCVGRAGG